MTLLVLGVKPGLHLLELSWWHLCWWTVVCLEPSRAWQLPRAAVQMLGGSALSLCRLETKWQR